MKKSAAYRLGVKAAADTNALLRANLPPKFMKQYLDNVSTGRTDMTPAQVIAYYNTNYSGAKTIPVKRTPLIEKTPAVDYTPPVEDKTTTPVYTPPVDKTSVKPVLEKAPIKDTSTFAEQMAKFKTDFKSKGPSGELAARLKRKATADVPVL